MDKKNRDYGVEVLRLCNALLSGRSRWQANNICHLRAISLFWSLKDKKRSGSRIIYAMAPTAFGIYLLHENRYFGGRDSLLWIKIFHLNDAITDRYFVFQLLLSGLIVFLICMAVAFAVRIIIKMICKMRPLHCGLIKLDDWYGGV